MSYTEVKERNRKKYYYRVISVRKGEKVSKMRKYLGVNLLKKELFSKEKEADEEFIQIYKEKKMQIIEKLKPKIIKILKKYHIKRAGIFGSYARGEARKDSDIDILVEPAKGMGFNFFGMNLELEEKMGKKVHLVTYKFISPYIKKNILKEEVRII